MACTALGTTTPVLGLCKPGQLEAVDWTAAINGNWDLLDAAIASISGGPTIASGLYGVRGLLGQNGASPNTVYGLTASLVQFRVPATNVVALALSPTVSIDMTVVGANGIDAGAMAASTWYHLYFIRHPTGPVIAGVASLVAPPTGPTLPSGYTSWAYAGAVRSNASTNFIQTYMRGAWAFYAPHLSAVSAGAPAVGVETSASLAALIPPNALAYMTDQWFQVTNSTVAGFLFKLRAVPGLDSDELRGLVAVAAGAGLVQSSSVLPNVDNVLRYLWSVDSGTGSAPSANVFVKGYSVANGDS